MQALKVNPVNSFGLQVEILDALKTKKTLRYNVFLKKKKKSGLIFNPGLALIDLRTTGP